MNINDIIHGRHGARLVRKLSGLPEGENKVSIKIDDKTFVFKVTPLRMEKVYTCWFTRVVTGLPFFYRLVKTERL